MHPQTPRRSDNNERMSRAENKGHTVSLSLPSRFSLDSVGCRDRCRIGIFHLLASRAAGGLLACVLHLLELPLDWVFYAMVRVSAHPRRRLSAVGALVYPPRMFKSVKLGSDTFRCFGSRPPVQPI